MTSNFGIHSHGLIQTDRGLCTDEAPHVEIDAMLTRAVEQVKDVEAERDRYREALRDVVASRYGPALPDALDVAEKVLGITGLKLNA